MVQLVLREVETINSLNCGHFGTEVFVLYSCSECPLFAMGVRVISSLRDGCMSLYIGICKAISYLLSLFHQQTLCILFGDLSWNTAIPTPTHF